MPPKVNAVANAHAILKFLAEQDSSKGVTFIARQTGISASSTYNILKTLVELELVAFRPETKGYELGVGIFELARIGISNRQILLKIQPILTKLAEEYVGQSGLWEFSGNIKFIVALGEAATPARLNLRIGQSFPIGAGSSGRAYLSRYAGDEAKLKRAFREVNWRGNLSFEEYQSGVMKAAKIGYAIDRDHLFPGVATVSSALVDPITRREYCLSCFLLSPAHSAASLRAIGEHLSTISQDLERTFSSRRSDAMAARL